VRIRRLVARGYRNLADLDREAPSPGLVLLGANAQGKTNLLEAIYYPVLFRSFRGAADGQLVGAPPGFSVELHIGGGPAASVTATYSGRKKRITINGEAVDRLADSVGHWLAVAFLPADVGLASGPAIQRRRYLDRVLSLSDRRYLRALIGYRAALAQRNSALRQGRVDLAQAFNGALATAGAAWSGGVSTGWPAPPNSSPRSWSAWVSRERPVSGTGAAWSWPTRRDGRRCWPSRCRTIGPVP